VPDILTARLQVAGSTGAQVCSRFDLDVNNTFLNITPGKWAGANPELIQHYVKMVTWKMA
jgi:hypothetical protein